MSNQSACGAARRAFSMMELMVVLLIILLVITIAIPSLSGARNMARSSATQGLMNQITQAAAQFERDHRRMPGYFSGSDMGHTENATRGFSAMQNVMLDLAGGITGTGATSPEAGSIQVGPHNGAQVWVNPGYIGVARDGSDVYFTPDGKHFIAQNEHAGQQSAEGAPQHRDIPSVVDAWGTPLLAWVKNDLAIGPIRNADDFARVASGGTNASRFYWNANAAFLQATGTGRRFINQTEPERGSILMAANDENRRRSLIGILGHPSFPHRESGSNMPPELPSAVRGSIVVHSAGTDGYFFGRRDRGARQFDLAARPFIDYRVNFAPNPEQAAGGANQYTDREGRVTNVDVTADFDDLLAVGGN